MSSILNNAIAPGEWTSTSPQATFELGRTLGERLEGGEVLLLSGPLGAGKTLFVKGIASALGVDSDEVTSPSFTLVNKHEGRLLFYHLDLYRLDDGAGAGHAVDLEELIENDSAVVVIEWAERLQNFHLPSSTWQISIVGDGESPRYIRIFQGNC